MNLLWLLLLPIINLLSATDYKVYLKFMFIRCTVLLWNWQLSSFPVSAIEYFSGPGSAVGPVWCTSVCLSEQ